MKKVPIDKLNELHSQGLNDNEIANRLGFNRTTINKARRRLGLKSNYQPVKLVSYYKNKITELYNQGYTINEISKKVGFSYLTVLNFCKRDGLYPIINKNERRYVRAEIFLEAFLNYLEINGPSSRKEIIENTNLTEKWCKNFIDIYPDIFEEFTFRVESKNNKYKSYELFGDLSYEKCGPIYSLLNDSRLIEYFSDKIPFQIANKKDAFFLTTRLNRCLGRERSLQVVKSCKIKTEKRKIKGH